MKAAALGLLIALFITACGRKPEQDEASRQRYERFKVASDAFERGDLTTARESFQDIVDRAKQEGRAHEERSGYLGLARVHACLGERETAERILTEYADLRADAVGPADLSLSQDGIDMGLIYSALGNTDEARASFEQAARALDLSPKKTDWTEPGKLLNRWLLLHTDAAEGELEPLREAIRGYRGKAPSTFVFILRSRVEDLEACDWNREAMLLREFAREMGVDGPVGPEMPEGTVSRLEARFSLPLSRRDEWRWFLPTTMEHAREYAWMVEVTNEGQRYELGYSLVKRPGAVPQQGALGDLLQAGQVDVWKFSEDGMSMRSMEDTGIQAMTEGKGVVIRLDNPEVIRQLFSGRPAAKMVLQAPGRPMAVMDFPIEYN